MNTLTFHGSRDSHMPMSLMGNIDFEAALGSSGPGGGQAQGIYIYSYTYIYIYVYIPINEYIYIYMEASKVTLS